MKIRNSVICVFAMAGIMASPARAISMNCYPQACSSQMIDVGDNIKLEVLDWGGSGRPLILLAGMGNTAHDWDEFAAKLVGAYHVYGITRRGFGESSRPIPGNGNYSADRLGDDVLTVIDALKLDRPILVGHSVAGEELSSIGSRHPEKVAGLVYLDAAYSYAYYNRSRGDWILDLLDVQSKLNKLMPGVGGEVRQAKILVQDLIQTSLPQLEKDLQEREKNMEKTPDSQIIPENGPVGKAIMAGEQKYTDIKVPVLAIFAVPHAPPPQFLADHASWDADDLARTGAQADAFEAGVPSAHVVRLAHADHYIFKSNEADVLREIVTFSAHLPKQNKSAQKSAFQRDR